MNAKLLSRCTIGLREQMMNHFSAANRQDGKKSITQLVKFEVSIVNS